MSLLQNIFMDDHKLEEPNVLSLKRKLKESDDHNGSIVSRLRLNTSGSYNLWSSICMFAMNKKIRNIDLDR